MAEPIALVAPFTPPLWTLAGNASARTGLLLLQCFAVPGPLFLFCFVFCVFSVWRGFSNHDESDSSWKVEIEEERSGSAWRHWMVLCQCACWWRVRVPVEGTLMVSLTRYLFSCGIGSRVRRHWRARPFNTHALHGTHNFDVISGVRRNNQPNASIALARLGVYRSNKIRRTDFVRLTDQRQAQRGGAWHVLPNDHAHWSAAAPRPAVVCVAVIPPVATAGILAMYCRCCLCSL